MHNFVNILREQFGLSFDCWFKQRNFSLRTALDWEMQTKTISTHRLKSKRKLFEMAEDPHNIFRMQQKFLFKN